MCAGYSRSGAAATVGMCELQRGVAFSSRASYNNNSGRAGYSGSVSYGLASSSCITSSDGEIGDGGFRY